MMEESSHDRIKPSCKKCKDTIKVTIQNWLQSARQGDRKYNRYDADRFIDKCFLKGVVEDFPTCYYEGCKLLSNTRFYQDDLAMIERLDNSIGHIKINCVLSCLRWNRMKKSDKENKLSSSPE